MLLTKPDLHAIKGTERTWKYIQSIKQLLFNNAWENMQILLSLLQQTQVLMQDIMWKSMFRN